MKKNQNYWISGANNTVYRPGQRTGHYESYFLRANHPSKPLAFWIRYTIFSPQGSPEKAIGELWAVYFDGETKTNIAVKKEVPFDRCSFSPSALDVNIEDAILNKAMFPLTYVDNCARLYLRLDMECVSCKSIAQRISTKLSLRTMLA